jgi:hypothetical protein
MFDGIHSFGIHEGVGKKGYEIAKLSENHQNTSESTKLNAFRGYFSFLSEISWNSTFEYPYI